MSADNNEYKSLAQMQVNPFVAAAVILVLCAFVGVYYWSTGRSAEFAGPTHMHLSPKGELHIQVGNQLLLYDADGSYIDQLDMGQLGIDFSMGDFAFFNNGDMLLRVGEYDLSLSERIDSYQRKEQSDQEQPQSAGQGLTRCSIPDLVCRPFGDIRISFNRVYHLYIDPQTEHVYVADSSRHRLRKYNSEGTEIALSKNAYRFPNQMFWHQDNIYVANTNHHSIRIIKPETNSFGSLIDQIEVTPEQAHENNETWPIAVVQVDDNWWVINMENDMSHGGVYVFDSKWDYQKRLSLPEDADPVDLLVSGDEVLISDYDNLRIYRVSKQGKLLGMFSDPQMDKLLSQTKSQREFYDTVTNVSVIAFALFIVAGIILALRQSGKKESSADDTIIVHGEDIDINDPSIVWIEPKQSQKKWTGIGIVLFVAVMVLTTAMLAFSLSGNKEIIFFSVIMFAMLPLMLTFYTRYRCRIGVLGDVLIVQDNRKRFMAAKGEHVLYSDIYIVIDSIAISLGTNAASIYPKAQLIEHVYPILNKGTELDNRKMNSLLIYRKNSLVILPLIYALIILIIFLLAWQL